MRGSRYRVGEVLAFEADLQLCFVIAVLDASVPLYLSMKSIQNRVG